MVVVVPSLTDDGLELSVIGDETAVVLLSFKIIENQNNVLLLNNQWILLVEQDAISGVTHLSKSGSKTDPGGQCY